MKEKPKFKETHKKWTILGTRKDGTQWISSQAYFDRIAAVQFKRDLVKHVESKLKIVRVLVTIETI